jgi:hypothetical protein
VPSLLRVPRPVYPLTGHTVKIEPTMCPQDSDVTRQIVLLLPLALYFPNRFSFHFFAHLVPPDIPHTLHHCFICLGYGAIMDIPDQTSMPPNFILAVLLEHHCRGSLSARARRVDIGGATHSRTGPCIPSRTTIPHFVLTSPLQSS